ncbi:MAG: HD domain-containing phosphohydrolase [Pyrinomonadaceae bacterium]
MTYKIMIVDDEPANLRLLERLFRRDYQVISAASGLEALHLLNQHDVALIITDQRMPAMTGIELLKRTASFRPHMVRIVLTGYTDIGSLVEAINCGQVYRYVTKPWNNDDLRQVVERALEHYETNKSHHELEQANHRLSVRLQEMTRGIVRAIADALEAKDEHVFGHARRVSGYATAIGRRMRLDLLTLEQLSLAAFLHDIGKIGTPDRILLKPGPFTEDEWSCIMLHSERGARMLSGVPEMEEIASIVRHHHEHYDGTGYPESLCGEQIPLASRIVLVADAYDAMTSPRPFRAEACSHEYAVSQLENESGKHFDPEVVRAFCGLEALSKIRSHIALGACGGRLSSLPFPRNTANHSFEELVREVESEPVIAACLLREANSRKGSLPVANIRVACELLGEEQLRNALSQPFERDACEHNPEQLWEHSVRCAIAARLLAEQTGILEPEEAFALGLLHDIGEVLLRSLFSEEMEKILWLTDDARLDREVAAFGVDHAQVGHWILEACGLPRSLLVAVQAHHDAMRINAPAALLLHVADAIAHANDASEIAAIDSLGSDRLSQLRLTRFDVARVHGLTTESMGQRFTAMA